MNEKLRKHIDLLFLDAPKSKETMEVKEELAANLFEHCLDLVESGKSEEEAFAIVISNIGDVKELIQNLKDSSSIEGNTSNENMKQEGESKKRSYTDKGWSLGNMLDDFIGNISSAFEMDCNVVSDQSYSSDTLHTVNIAFISESIRFYLHDSNDIRIVELMSKNPSPDELARVTICNGEMNIKGGRRLFFIAKSKVDIYLPRSYHGNLIVRVTSSSIKIEETFKLKNVLMRGVSCSIKGRSILSENIDIHVGSGSIKLNELAGQHLLSTESGAIHIDRMIGGGECKTTSGSIHVAYDQLDSNLCLSTISGSVRLFVPESVSFNYYATTVSGSIHTCFNSNQYSSSRNKVQGQVGETPDKNINIKVVSGSIWMQNN